jgi:hypothetical protein
LVEGERRPTKKDDASRKTTERPERVRTNTDRADTKPESTPSEKKVGGKEIPVPISLYDRQLREADPMDRFGVRRGSRKRS